MTSISRRLSTRKFLTNCQIELTRALIDCIVQEGSWGEALEAGEVRLADRIRVRYSVQDGVEEIRACTLRLDNYRTGAVKTFIAYYDGDELLTCLTNLKA